MINPHAETFHPLKKTINPHEETLNPLKEIFPPHAETLNPHKVGVCSKKCVGGDYSQNEKKNQMHKHKGHQEALRYTKKNKKFSN